MSNRKTINKTRAFWPAIGFILALSVGIVAWALGPVGYDFLLNYQIVNFGITGISRRTWELIISGVVFVVLLLLASLIVAAARPRQKSQVRETEMVKQREKMLREQKARKILQQQINRKMKDR